jgi:hypothetical protein
MSGTCSMHGLNEKYSILVRNLKGKDHLGDLRVDGGMLLN